MMMLAAACLLSGCAAQRPVDQSITNAAQIAGLKKFEIFYNPEAYIVLVRPSGGLLALASIGEGGRMEERTKQLTAAFKQSFPDQDINLQFAQALAGKIREKGGEVKITRMVQTTSDLNKVKTPGYAPLRVQAVTGYVAPSFTQGFQSWIYVDYYLGDAESDRPLIGTGKARGGAGPSYMTFDQLLAAQAAAHEQLRVDLVSMAQEVYGRIFR